MNLRSSFLPLLSIGLMFCNASLVAKPVSTVPTFGIWTTYGANAAHNSYIDMKIGKPSTFHQLWTKTVFSSDSKDLGQIVTTNKALYLSNLESNTFLALDAFDGGDKWHQQLTNISSFDGPSYANNKLFIQTIGSNEGGTIYAYDSESGDSLYQGASYSTQWAHYYAPTPYQSGLYFTGGEYGGVNAFKPNVGVTVQNLGSGETVRILNVTGTSFDIVIRNAADNGNSNRTFTFTAVGYGKGV